MFVHKLQLTAAVVLTLGLAGTGAGVLLQSAPEKGVGNPPVDKRVAAADPPVHEPGATDKKDGKLRSRDRIRQTRRVLSQDVSLDPIDATLNEALDLISTRFKINFNIDEDAFAGISVPKPGETQVRLPRVTNVPLNKVLARLLKQVKGDLYRGAYLVRPDGIEVTTNYHVWLAAGADPAGLNGEGLLDVEPIDPTSAQADCAPETRELGYFGKYRRMTTVVHVDCEQQPLTEALRDLSDETNYDIVVDPRVRDKAKTPVTLFLNVAWLDNAVTLLTEMAELDWYWMDRVIFVTSRENAKLRKDKIKALDDERRKLLNEAAKAQASPSPTSDPALVNVKCSKQPLADVLSGIAQVQTVIDNRVADNAKTVVTVTLNQVPAETAIRILADMADLGAAKLGDVYYITSKENARNILGQPATPAPAGPASGPGPASRPAGKPAMPPSQPAPQKAFFNGGSGL